MVHYSILTCCCIYFSPLHNLIYTPTSWDCGVLPHLGLLKILIIIWQNLINSMQMGYFSISLIKLRTQHYVLTEKAMAPHSSTPAWEIPWAEEPGRLQSMGSRRVGHDWATSLSLFTFMHWRRKWQPTPVLLPGESHGQRSLARYSPWGRKESDTTEQLSLSLVSNETFC